MSKLITFISIETDGLHLDKSSDRIIKKNLYKYAHLVKIIYHQGIYKKGKIKTSLKKSFLVKPEHFFFPNDLTKINQLTQDKLEKKGKDLEDVMNEFISDLKNSQVIVGHNIPFIIKTLIASLYRAGISHTFDKYTIIDIINFNHQIEKPSLKNISKEILGDTFENKSRNFQIVLIKKIFAQLYLNLETQVKDKK